MYIVFPMSCVLCILRISDNGMYDLYFLGKMVHKKGLKNLHLKLKNNFNSHRVE